MNTRLERKEESSSSEEDAAREGDHALAETIREPAADHGGDCRHQRTRRQRDTGAEDRVMPDTGEEEDVAEQQREESHREDEAARVRDRERADAEKRKLDHGSRVSGRPPEKERKQHGGRGKGADDSRRAPAPLAPLDDSECQRPDPTGQYQGTDGIGEVCAWLAALVQQSPRGQQRRQPDQDVDEEDSTPALPVDEYASERRTGRRCDGTGGAPQCGSGRAALERELRQQQAERGGHEHRPAERLDGTSGDEQLDGVRGAADDGGGEKHEDAEEEEATSPVSVGESSRRNERGCKDDAVGVQDPGKLAQRALRE